MAVGANTSLWESAQTQLKGFSLTMTPGKVGEVYKCYLVEQRTGVPLARTAPIVLFEKAMDAVTFSSLALLTASLLPNLSEGVATAARRRQEGSGRERGERHERSQRLAPTARGSDRDSRGERQQAPTEPQYTTALKGREDQECTQRGQRPGRDTRN